MPASEKGTDELRPKMKKVPGVRHAKPGEGNGATDHIVTL